MALPLLVIVGAGAITAGTGYAIHEHIRNENELAKDKYGRLIAEYFFGTDGKSATAEDLYPLLVYREKGELTDDEDDEIDDDKAFIANAFIRWDAFCHILNKHNIPKNPKDGKPIFAMSCVQLINEDLPLNDRSNRRQGKHISPILMAKVDNPLKDLVNVQNNEKLLDSSLDPTICLLPNQQSKTLSHTYSKQLKPFLVATGYLEALGDESTAEEFGNMCDYELTDDEKRYQIGHIYLNVKKLQQLYQSMKYDADGVQKEDFYLYDYIKKIWENVNEACAGNHTFKLTTDFERPHIVRVVDMRYQENKSLKSEDIININIQSNDSIVRDFAYNTSIPSALSATIAIAAQSPRDINNIEGASFGAFHKNISNRFARFNVDQQASTLDQEQIDTLAKSFDEELTTYITGFVDLGKHLDEVKSGKYHVLAEGGDAVSSEEIGKYKGLVNAIKRASKSLIKRYPDTRDGHYKGQFIPREVQEPTSAIVPLKFNATLDGISGIIIGNVFRIEKSRLPRGYKDANVGFVVMGEEQAITSGQDWTTKIIGQMIILDDPSKNQQQASDWAGYDYNDYDESAKTETQYDGGADSQGISEEQQKIDEDLSAIREGDKIYLKIDDDYTHVRTGAEVNMEGTADWGDNVIGVFKKRNAGLYLGTVREIKNTGIYKQAQNGKYYKVDSDGTIPWNADPVDPKKIPNDNWPWYKIKFAAAAKKKIKVGWIYNEGELDKDGADKGDNEAFVKYNLGWMRIDVLLGEAKALQIQEQKSLEEDVAMLEREKGIIGKLNWKAPNSTYKRILAYIDFIIKHPDIKINQFKNYLGYYGIGSKDFKTLEDLENGVVSKHSSPGSQIGLKRYREEANDGKKLREGGFNEIGYTNLVFTFLSDEQILAAKKEYLEALPDAKFGFKND
jgi:hypothetical protein